MVLVQHELKCRFTQRGDHKDIELEHFSFGRASHVVTQIRCPEKSEKTRILDLK